MDNNHIETKIAEIQQEFPRSIAFDTQAIQNEYIETTHKESLAMQIFIFIGSFLAFTLFFGYISTQIVSMGALAGLIFGIILLLASLWLSRSKTSFLFETLELFLYLNGLGLIGYCFGEFEINPKLISLIFFASSIITLAIYNNYFILFVASWLSLMSFTYFFVSFFPTNEFLVSSIIISFVIILATYYFLNEGKIIKLLKSRSVIYNQVRLSIVIYLLSTVSNLNLIQKITESSAKYSNWILFFTAFFAILYVINYLLDNFKITNLTYKIGIFFLTSLVLIPTGVSPNIAISLLILLLSFTINYKIGLVLSIIALLYSVSMFYYDLKFTLLVKSVLLMASGILFLCLYFFSKSKLKTL